LKTQRHTQYTKIPVSPITQAIALVFVGAAAMVSGAIERVWLAASASCRAIAAS